MRTCAHMRVHLCVFVCVCVFCVLQKRGKSRRKRRKLFLHVRARQFLTLPSCCAVLHEASPRLLLSQDHAGIRTYVISFFVTSACMVTISTVFPTLYNLSFHLSHSPTLTTTHARTHTLTHMHKHTYTRTNAQTPLPSQGLARW